MQAGRGVLVYDEASARHRRDPARGFPGTIGGALGAIST